VLTSNFIISLVAGSCLADNNQQRQIGQNSQQTERSMLTSNRRFWQKMVCQGEHVLDSSRVLSHRPSEGVEDSLARQRHGEREHAACRQC